LEDTEIIDLYWERSERAIAETHYKYGEVCHSLSLNIVQDVQDIIVSVRNI